MRFDDNSDWKNQCTGCLACFNVCPKGAITLNESSDGFIYPLIDDKLCVSCGMCNRSCVIYSIKRKNKPVSVRSACTTDDAIRMRGSSGGIFELMANNCVKSGGVVFGAALDKDRKGIRHFSTKEVSIEKLLRSKYSQSYVGKVYSEAGLALKEGKKVLFAGTPCQIRGLKG